MESFWNLSGPLGSFVRITLTKSDGMSSVDGQELLKTVDPEYLLSLITKDKEEKAKEADKKAAAAEKRKLSSEKRKAAAVPAINSPTPKRLSYLCTAQRRVSCLDGDQYILRASSLLLHAHSHRLQSFCLGWQRSHHSCCHIELREYNTGLDSTVEVNSSTSKTLFYIDCLIGPWSDVWRLYRHLEKLCRTIRILSLYSKAYFAQRFTTGKTYRHLEKLCRTLWAKCPKIRPAFDWISDLIGRIFIWSTSSFGRISNG